MDQSIARQSLNSALVIITAHNRKVCVLLFTEGCSMDMI